MKKSYLLVLIVLWAVLAGCTDAGPTRVDPTPTSETLQGPTGDLVATTLPDTAVPETTPATEASAPPLAPMEVSEPEEGDLAELPPCSGTLTSRNMEGPYYTSGSPQRTSLIEPGMPGVPILILGRVFDQDCNPIPEAKVDFWQADMNGVYDNSGYILRGYVITGEDGYYNIETIEPGEYPGRPPHIHVKVFAPGGEELLTTQLYFPGSESSGDVRAAPDLLVEDAGQDEAGRQLAFFNFVVST